MFLDMEDFINCFLCSPETVSLVTYERQETLKPFLSRLIREFSKNSLKFQEPDVSEDNIDEFCKKITTHLHVPDSQNVFLILSGLEPLLPYSGTILNGFREKLSQFAGIIILLRRNRLRDFEKAAPDLMSLVRSFFIRAEQIPEPITEDQVL